MKRNNKPRLVDGVPNVDITLNDGVSPVIKKKRVPLSELDEVLAEFKRKMG